MTPDTANQPLPFEDFLHNFQASLQNVFHHREDSDQLGSSRGLPPYVLREIMANNPFSAFIPAEYGGRGGMQQEGIALTEAASYASLPLALTFGINWALFIQPVAKYADPQTAATVFNDLQQNRKMAGLMITEPDYGSDALHMQSSWTPQNGQCRIQGTKHWAGLTGWADYWLLTARQQSSKGLARDIDFFICDANHPEQRIVVEEKFKNLGLYMIPYGRNRIDVAVPTSSRLIPETTGIKMMLDILHRSRMQFPAMAMGFIRRILDEASTHCRERMVGGKSLLGYDQVQARLARIQTAFTICSAACLNSSETAGIENNLAAHGLIANAIKTSITDLMQEAAQSLLQLVGAKGYRLDHFAGRAIVDSRPFQIFEGSNDILYVQIAEAILKQMKIAKVRNFFQFSSQQEQTRRASSHLKKLLGFDIAAPLSQRKLVILGQIISRILMMDLVLQLSERGFSEELIDCTRVNLQQEIAAMLTRFSSTNQTKRLAPDQEYPCWRDYC